MRIKITVLIATVLVAVLSCKKSSSREESQMPETKVTKKLLIRIGEKDPTNQASVTAYTTFDYDDQGRLIKEKGLIQDIQYVYEQDRLVLITQTIPSTKISSNITYEGNKVSKIVTLTKPNNLAEYTEELICFYQGDKLTRAVRTRGGVTTIENTYEYNGDKLTKVVLKIVNGTTVQDYTTDGKKNIHHDLSLHTFQVLKLLRTEPPILDNVLTNSAFSKLNQVETLIEQTYTYTYDIDGFPLTATLIRKRNGVQTNTTNYTYEYKTIEINP